MKQRFVIIAVAFATIMAPACQERTDDAGYVSAEQRPVLSIMLKDLSRSISVNEQRFFDAYLEGRVIPLIRPGDRAIVAKIGSDPLSGFGVLAEHDFHPAFYCQPSPMSFRYFTEDLEQSRKQCISDFHEFETEHRDFKEIVHGKLLQPATDDHTCLIDTIRLVADYFSRYEGLKVLAATTDGLEDCRGLDFAHHAPTAQTLEALNKQGRIPKLTGVTVYFLCRTDHPVVSYDLIDAFWELFFKAAGATAVRVAPNPDFDYRSPATLKQQCGR